jgi:hypothetical protein
MQRRETTPDDQAEGLEYHSGYVRTDEQYVGESHQAFDRTDPAMYQRAYVILDAGAAFTHNTWEGGLFTNRPRTIPISLQRSL